MNNHSKYTNLPKINLKNVWYLFLIIAVPIVCVGGASYIPYNLRLPLIYATGIGFVVMFIFSDLKIKLNVVTVSSILLLAYIAISCLYSLDPSASFYLFTIYLSAFTLLFLDIPRSIISKIITVIYVFCTVIAVSILLSALIKDCMNTYFWFVNPSRSPEVARAITREISFGSYSGLAREMSDAAYIMNVGLGISFAKYFSKGKLTKSEILIAVIFLVAIMLTGKRTMFLIPLFCMCIFLVFSNVKNKVFKFLSIFIIFLVAIFIIMMFVPEMANIINKFLDNENMENMGGRTSLWPYIFKMISRYWIFGAGFNTYNEFAYQQGLRVNGKRWEYNAHNSYFQILGELGIMGMILFLLFAVAALIFTFRLLKLIKDDQELQKFLYFSLYIQIMIFVYATTGNPLYTRQIIYMWAFAIGISLVVGRTFNTKKSRSLKEYEQ